jgi:hypothetical protein
LADQNLHWGLNGGSTKDRRYGYYKVGVGRKSAVLIIWNETQLLDKGTDEDLISGPPDPNKTSPKKAGLKQSLPFFWIFFRVIPW